MPDSHWTLLSRRRLIDLGILQLYGDRYRVEPGGAEKEFSVFEGPDWVNVVPLTPAGEVVLIRQYRHGVRRVTLEIPGGMVDPGESPAAAAARELEEETGYRAGAVESLGVIDPNPALQANRCHCFVARGVRVASAPRPDAFERIEVVREPLAEVPRLVTEGLISHALVVAAFGLLGLSDGALG